MATQSSILAWKIPWTEEPGRLPSICHKEFDMTEMTWRKGEKERHKHLNAKFQRIARRDKKTFLSDQCKEIEDNNRMGKTRDLFKKTIRDTKGTFHAKMGSIKDRNGMDLQKQKILRRGDKNTQNCTKKILTTQIIMMV